MTRQHRRIFPLIAAPIVLIVAMIGALSASTGSAVSAPTPSPAAASTSPTPTPSGSTSLPRPPIDASCIVGGLCPNTVDYYAPPDTTSPADPTVCQQTRDHPYVPGTRCHVDLRGVLYLPNSATIKTGAKNTPLVIFVHGSTDNDAAPSQNEVAGMATYFTRHNFAFFALHRRGHGDSTGQNLDGVPEDPTACDADRSRAACDISTVDNLCRQVFEVRQAISKLNSLMNGLHDPIVDPTKIAVLGHSLGGIVSLCANTQDIGLRTIVDIAGASESWDYYDGEDGVLDGHSPTITMLNQMVIDHVTPPMFLEAINDCSTTPTDQFTIDVMDRNELYASEIFPNVTEKTTSPYGGRITDCSVAHVHFVFMKYWVDKWAPSVAAWLDSRFAKADSINTD
jgi:pimeloyl-ACP methyl ester carboxylesterase